MTRSDSAGDVLVFRPRRLTVLATGMSVALIVLVIVGWFALPMHLRSAFTWSQRLTLLALVAVLEVVMISVAASYVRADDEGLRIRNGLRRHTIAWHRVYKILLRPGDPWAIALLLPEDGGPFQVDLDAEKRQLMGIQAGDGELAREAIVALRQRQQRALRLR